MFKRNEMVVKIISVMGLKSATIETVDSVKKGVVLLKDSGLEYNNENGMEIKPAIPGCFSEIVPFDGGEVEKWDLKDKPE